jgi:hypothetical protein
MPFYYPPPFMIPVITKHYIICFNWRNFCALVAKNKLTYYFFVYSNNLYN